MNRRHQCVSRTKVRWRTMKAYSSTSSLYVFISCLEGDESLLRLTLLLPEAAGACPINALTLRGGGVVDKLVTATFKLPKRCERFSKKKCSLLSSLAYMRMRGGSSELDKAVLRRGRRVRCVITSARASRDSSRSNISAGSATDLDSLDAGSTRVLSRNRVGKRTKSR